MMRNDPSPLQTLAAYAIVFAAGAISTTVFRLYGQYQYHKGGKAAQDRAAT
jgi:hypothetical protein